MTSIDVLDASGEKSGSLDLPAEIFDVQVNIPLIHQVVVAQQAGARQGTASTKNRGEVAGGGRKPYRQKGTGRARQGSIRAPQFAGGGVVHGPRPRSYDQRTPKKMKAAALRGALSDRARSGRVHVVDGLIDADTPSTKKALAALRGLTERPRVLVVLERTDELTWLSLRNERDVHLLAVDQLNTYDVLVSDDVVFTRAAYEALLARHRVAGAPATEPAAPEPAASELESESDSATEPEATSEAEATTEADSAAGAGSEPESATDGTTESEDEK
jgi:large subunit ribosomal protein L4